MLNYVRQLFNIRVVFHTLYLWTEVGHPNFFLAFLTEVTNLLTKSIEWKKNSGERPSSWVEGSTGFGSLGPKH